MDFRSFLRIEKMQRSKTNTNSDWQQIMDVNLPQHFNSARETESAVNSILPLVNQPAAPAIEKHTEEENAFEMEVDEEWDLNAGKLVSIIDLLLNRFFGQSAELNTNMREAEQNVQAMEDEERDVNEELRVLEERIRYAREKKNLVHSKLIAAKISRNDARRRLLLQEEAEARVKELFESKYKREKIPKFHTNPKTI